MKPKLVIVFLIIVLVPFAGLIWLGVSVAREDREMVQSRMNEVLTARLDDVDGRLGRILESHKQSMRDATRVSSEDPESIRRHMSSHPYARQVFIVGADGELVYPDRQADLIETEREFLLRTAQLWKKNDQFEYTKDDESESVEGWYGWYTENQLHLLYWRRDSTGRVIGAELSRVLFISDLINQLPATDTSTGGDEQIVLLDVRREPIYKWGGYLPPENEPPKVERSLSHPLNAWKLQYYVSALEWESTTRGGMIAGVAAGIVFLGLVCVGLAIYFFRENSREIEEATQRVSFVNQVSHELKTPLTNIRIYAELLEGRLEEDPEMKASLEVIISESQRLSRLINNVLTFARQRKSSLVLHATEGILDEVVDEMLAQFSPILEEKKVAIEFDRGAPMTLNFDRDLVAQVISNLVSNVEKYAWRGGRLEIRTSREGEHATIVVRDCGPGIPKARREDVFLDFIRLENAVNEGASGAGIGLGLSRGLARMHGGDLRIIECEDGCGIEFSFRADNPTPGSVSG